MPARSHNHFRRVVISLSIGLLFLPTAAVTADLLQPQGRVDRPQGSAAAAVTVIEYSSPTCSHCADYRNNAAPQIHAEFVETGLTRILFRPFPRNNIDVAIFMLADAQPDGKHVLDRFYAHHDEIVKSENMERTLREIAASVGIDHNTFDAAIKDQSALDNLRILTDQARDDFKIEGTPTFFINGKKITGAPSLEYMRREIAAALERK